ncbi:MAG: ABC transporter ATP-binding protein/permease [Spirochaetaceae bacterium]|nr:ABC transporter ATP-binding protein/permease [Spirochaetaceae bacterium]
MRHLPFDDPGTPNLRSPARYLLWTGRMQWRTLALGVVFGVVWMVAQALVPAAIGRGLQEGVAEGDLATAGRWSLVVLGLALVQAVFGVMRHRMAVDNWLRASFRAMQLLGRHSSLVGVAIRRRLPTGEVVSAATNDALHIGSAFDVSARLSGAVVSYVVVAVILLNASVQLGLVVLLGVPAMVLFLGPLLRPLQRRQHVQREVAGKLTALGADTVAGLRVLRGIGGEPAFFARYRERSTQLRAAGVHVAVPQATLDAAQVLLPGIFLVLVTWLSARLALAGTIDVGDVVAFYGYAFFLVVPIRTAIEAADKVTRSLVGARRIVAVLATEPEISDPQVAAAEPPLQATLADPSSGLTVEPGTMTALVSADPDDTAAIAHRLGRLVSGAESDLVTLGGTRLRDLPLSTVRRRVLVSEAEPRLFSGILRDELDPWARVSPDGERSRDDRHLTAAVHVAAAEDVLDALPEGLDAEVDEAGRGFSGGQRQRLALARAVLADPDVLVLVEPTSSVDAHTEILVAQRLRAARHTEGGRTTVVTTASPLLLDRCDNVAFVLSGRVVARGTHRHLLASHPGYRDTVTRGVEP